MFNADISQITSPRHLVHYCSLGLWSAQVWSGPLFVRWVHKITFSVCLSCYSKWRKKEITGKGQVRKPLWGRYWEEIRGQSWPGEVWWAEHRFWWQEAMRIKGEGGAGVVLGLVLNWQTELKRVQSLHCNTPPKHISPIFNVISNHKTWFSLSEHRFQLIIYKMFLWEPTQSWRKMELVVASLCSVCRTQCAYSSAPCLRNCESDWAENPNPNCLFDFCMFFF